MEALQQKFEDIISVVKSLGDEDISDAHIRFDNFVKELLALFETLRNEAKERLNHQQQKEKIAIVNEPQVQLLPIKVRRKSPSKSFNVPPGTKSNNSNNENEGNITALANEECSKKSEIEEPLLESSRIQTTNTFRETLTDDDSTEQNSNRSSVELETPSSGDAAGVSALSSEAHDATLLLTEGVRTKQRKPFDCKECGASFTTKGNYNVHLRKHTGQRPFSCPKCAKSFNTSSNLRRHVLSHQGLKPFQCKVCDARFTEKKSLMIHARKHTGEKPYECPTCSKRYASKWVLSEHLRTHEGVKPNLCHRCGKSFTQKCQLKLHEKRHTGIKPHVCSYCDMPFITRSDLRRHEKTHSGRGSFVCETCGKSFARNQSLKSHFKKHENEQSSEST